MLMLCTVLISLSLDCMMIIYVYVVVSVVLIPLGGIYGLWDFNYWYHDGDFPGSPV